MSDLEGLLEEVELPPMPQVASKIMGLVEDPRTNSDDIQKVIFADQALTSRILMVANSAFYGLNRRVDTLTDAIFVLGMESVKNISIALSTREIFQVHGFIEQKLWEHAIGVSVASGLIAGRQNSYKVSLEECIVGGLLHDIGHAILNLNNKERFSMVIEQVFDEKMPYQIAEEDIFGFTHQDVGALLFREWEMPDELIEVARNHHRCHHADFEETTEGLCKIVSMADCLCERLGIGFRDPMPELCPDQDIRMKSLGFGEEDIDELIEIFKERFIQEKQVFMG